MSRAGSWIESNYAHMLRTRNAYPNNFITEERQEVGRVVRVLVEQCLQGEMIGAVIGEFVLPTQGWCTSERA